MADAKISALDNLTSADPANDMIPIVDVSATPPASGNTKRISINNLLACSPTATLASATITGDLTVDTSTLKVDSTNNRVGIGTATPSVQLHLAGTDTTNVLFAGVTKGIRFVQSASTSLITGVDNTGAASYQPLSIGGSALDFSLSGTTAMTLNSTGLGIGDAPTTSTRLTVAAANRLADTTGQAYIRTTDSYAQDLGAQLTLGGLYNASANYAFGGIAGRKENGTINNVAGYLDFLTTTSAGALTSRMRIDSSGNLGIGVTPSAWSTTASRKAIQLSTAGSISAQDTGTDPYTFVASNWVSTATGDQYILGSAAPATLYRQFAGTHAWYYAAAGTGAVTFTQAMTLTAAGDLLVGQTTVAGANIDSFVYNKSGSYAIVSHVSGTGSGTGYIQFLYNNTSIGTITQNGTTGVLYNITSDYRLKESVAPLSGGLARVNALKPSVYNWKSDGSTGEGFLAHELAEVVPFAVSGDKDAVNADGTIKSQGIDMSRIVPILVAAIQELTARVQTLEAR